MQVHTFIAESANEAVDRIRTELGPSAVVLSVRKLPRTGLERFLKQEQIEVLAGVEETVPAKVSKPAVATAGTEVLAAVEKRLEERLTVLRNYTERPNETLQLPPTGGDFPTDPLKPTLMNGILRQVHDGVSTFEIIPARKFEA